MHTFSYTKLVNSVVLLYSIFYINPFKGELKTYANMLLSSDFSNKPVKDVSIFCLRGDWRGDLV